MKQPPIIVIHGGAGTIAPDLREAALAGVAAAARRGQAMLAAGAGAVDVAVAAVRLLEDDPTFNAGRGACLTADGEVEVDAGIMRSRDRRSGALAGVRNLRDPINVARRVMEATRHSLLVGEGAESFARAQGLGAFGRHEVETAKAVERWRQAKAGEAAIDNRADTVGAVVLDAAGELCAAGSTGGVLLKLPGRVGDTRWSAPASTPIPSSAPAAAPASARRSWPGSSPSPRSARSRPRRPTPRRSPSASATPARPSTAARRSA
ncbi:MAG: isoaspartyl peptidase/L-asparaginase [Myxococcales bacterium]|nr:isoaspartyl peptidase/L-asparaginase [Myxococcales bacterium]